MSFFSSRGGSRLAFARNAAALRTVLVLGLLALRSLAAAVDLPTLWAERVKCTVAVEYVTETEIERRPTASLGTVIDAAGTIILPSSAIDPRAATWQLKDFKVYLPGHGDSTPGTYLGQDALTGWHFVRASEKIRTQL